jgi:hypothetical protein
MNKTDDADGGDAEHRSNPRGSPDVEGQRIVNSQELLQGQKEGLIITPAIAGIASKVTRVVTPRFLPLRPEVS